MNNRFRYLLIIVLLCTALSLFADVKSESRHYLTTELGVGYSALLNQSPLGKSSGLAGGKLQVGYEWNYRRLLVHTGIEFASVNDRTKVNPFQLQIPYTVGLQAGEAMDEHFDFQSWTETQLMGQVNIPVQVGGIFADRYYFLAGARIGLPVLHSRKAKATVQTWLTDPTEVGVVLNSFFEKPAAKGKTKGKSSSADKDKKPVLYRVGLFADYGITSLVPGAKTGAPALADVAEPRQIALNDYFAASGSKVNSLLVGAKFAILFQLNEPKQAKPQKAVPSYMDIVVTDRQTAKALPAQVDIYDVAKQRTVRRDAPNGKVRYRANQGEYTVTARSESYYPDSVAVTIGEGVKERVELALTERPWLRLYVTNADTHVPVKATVRIWDAQTGDSVTVIRTASKTGWARSRLPEGNYRLTISRTGYEPYEQLITYIGDSLNISLVPLKVGRKVILHNLFFATGKTQILPQSEQALNELSDFLRDNPTVSIRITGHTDNVGSDKANMTLSEGRAKAVRGEIIKRGIAAERIEAEGKGETEPIADNATEEGRAQNRRVEFTIIATGGEMIEQIKQ